MENPSNKDFGDVETERRLSQRLAQQNLNEDAWKQLQQLRGCNPRLYQNPELVADLPGPELREYFTKCWQDGVWRRFVTNALPYVCLRA